MLQFIKGCSGSGKSTYLYNMISQAAQENREKKYIILVPDQFTLETQKIMVNKSKNGGILNIDVMSFQRLAYRIFENQPGLQRNILDDTGKMMILRKTLGEVKDQLKYFKKGLNKPGFLDECKSFFSELMQYGIESKDFEKIKMLLNASGLSKNKLDDLQLIYEEFQKKIGSAYMVAEEIIPQLTKIIPSVEDLNGSIICLDEFTGFTPTQYALLKELLTLCEEMYVTITSDRFGNRNHLFSMGLEVQTKLSAFAREKSIEIKPPIITGYGEDKESFRFINSPSLSFLETNLFVYGMEKYKKEADISIRVCAKEKDEIIYVTRKICDLLKKGYQPGEIAVVTGDLETYEQGLTSSFENLQIPYFVDNNKDIGANVLSEYILSFLEMTRKNMDYGSCFSFLRNSLSPLERDQVDLFENYVIARGKRGLKSYDSEWKYDRVKGTDIVLINEYRLKFLASVKDFIKEMRGKKSIRQFATILYRFLDENNIYEKLAQIGENFEKDQKQLLANEYKKIYGIVINLLEQMVNLLGDEIISFDEFEDLIKAGISEGIMGFIPPEENQVIIGDMERTRLKGIKILFFVGVNDDRIPKAAKSPGILSENERNIIADNGIELAPTNQKQINIDEFYLYLTLTKPSDFLYLTYPRMAGSGESKRPSFLIKRLERMFEKVEIEDDEKDLSCEAILGIDRGMHYFVNKLSLGNYDEDDIWYEIAAYHEKRNPGIIRDLLSHREVNKKRSKLSVEIARRLYGESIYGSVTRMEKFAKCPFAYYILYGLGLSERQVYDVSVIDYGNVFHEALEHISHMMDKDNISWTDLTDETIKNMSNTAIDFVAESYKGKMFEQSKRVEFMLARMKRVLYRSVWGISKQMQQGEFVQIASEREFSGRDIPSMNIHLPDGKNMVFNGKIDRIDICQKNKDAYIKIIDYKSGKNDLLLENVYYGLSLQLLTYMKATMDFEDIIGDKNPVPAALLYYYLNEPEIEWQNEAKVQWEERVLKELKCSGYVNDEPQILEMIDKDIAKDGKMIGGEKSMVVPVGTKKDGCLSKESNVLSTGEFETLMKHVNKKLVEFGQRIYEGEIGSRPYELGESDCCKYCPYNGICGLEKKNFNDCKNEMKKLSEEEIWRELNADKQVDI